MLARAGTAYRRYAAIRGWPTGLAKLIVVIALLMMLRDELGAYLVITLALLDAYVKRAVRDDRPLSDIGLAPHRASTDVGGGFLVGAAYLTAAIGVMFAFGWYRIVDTGVAGPARFARALLLFALVALTEEILSRGMLLRWLEGRFGSWVALALSSLAFGFAHLPNPGATVWSGVAVSVAGVLLGGLYLATRSLWVPIGAHWSWNLFEGPVFGASVSGAEFDVVTDGELEGPDLWTGGQFGPEEGLTMVLLGAALAIAVLVVAVRRGRISGRSPERRTEHLTHG